MSGCKRYKGILCALDIQPMVPSNLAIFTFIRWTAVCNGRNGVKDVVDDDDEQDNVSTDDEVHIDCESEIEHQDRGFGGDGR